MKIIRKKDLEKISFIDFDVTNTSIDKTSHSIIFSLNGGLQLVDDKHIEFGKGYLKISNYYTISITSFNAKEKIEHVLSEDDFESLSELCEIDINENNLVIKGFAKNTSNWVEFNIIGGKVAGEFSDTKSEP